MPGRTTRHIGPDGAHTHPTRLYDRFLRRNRSSARRWARPSGGSRPQLEPTRDFELSRARARMKHIVSTLGVVEPDDTSTPAPARDTRECRASVSGALDGVKRHQWLDSQKHAHSSILRAATHWAVMVVEGAPRDVLVMVCEAVCVFRAPARI